MIREDFDVEWNADRNMATARMRFGDMEVSAHHHVARDGRTGIDSIAFQCNSGRGELPFIDFGTHLPAGGYRRLAAMLTALADEVDADEARQRNLSLDLPAPAPEPTP